LFACGDGGVWCHDGRRWSSWPVPDADQPQRIYCGHDGRVYLIDRSPDVLVGDPSTQAWQRVAGTGQSVRCATWFAGRLVLSSDGTLLEVRGPRLVPCSLPASPLSRCTDLAARDGVLLVAGPHEAAFFDGARWSMLI
jgi:hypothetical protein